jgi:mannose-6-phosphate isomerase-like protein (cupin superfamily)
MACVRIAFDAMQWQPGTHPLERKKVCESRAVALLELGVGFADPQQCQRSHVIYVVQGRLELELETGVECLDAGQSCFLDRDTPHRARNGGDSPVIIFVASDLEALP